MLQLVRNNIRCVNLNFCYVTLISIGYQTFYLNQVVEDVLVKVFDLKREEALQLA